MVQPSRIFELWTRLYRRFLIEPFPADGAGPSVSTTIQPTTDADELLSESLADSQNADLSASAGSGVPIYTVPAGKRWTLKHAFREATIANSRIYMFMQGGTIYLTALGTAEQAVDLSNIKLRDGEGVGMFTTGNGADTAIFLMLVYEETDAYI